MGPTSENATTETGGDGVIARAVAAVRNNPVVSGVAGVVVLGVVAWLAFGIFGVHTLFIDDEVDEANPFANLEVEVEADVDAGVDAESTGGDGDALVEDTSAAEPATDPAVDEATTTTTEAAPTITTEASGSFISLDHPTSGDAVVLTNGEQRFLRLENFETDNGPDLNVYLATGDPDGDLGDFIDLGNLKGNIGDQNYELDPDIDLAEYDSVFVWCVRFGVGFGAAGLS